ncbi:MAG: N-acetylmuramoyl-L-alanine amidase, partial [Anaerolineae bacterium]|nr:N-acetylmuramoyl-L-alanine amidase [Anaerolineae bacterium]
QAGHDAETIMADDHEQYWHDDDESADHADHGATEAYAADAYDYDYDPDAAPAADDQPPDTSTSDDSVFERRTFDSGTLEADDDVTPIVTRPPAGGPTRMGRSVSTASALNLPLQRPHPAEAAAPPAPPTGPSMPRARPTAHHPGNPRTWWVTLRTLIIVLIAAVGVSTVFSLWIQPDFLSDEFVAGLNQVQATQRVINIQPSPLPTEQRQVRIGIIAGHSGPPAGVDSGVDPGAVCPDGLTELEINEAVSREVVASLRRLEYEVDLLQEFDDRLIGYQADILLSIHANDCQDYGVGGTGYNAASAFSRQSTAGADERLLACLISQYGQATGLPFHEGVTEDMTGYHTFGEVSLDTPTAILELGFMLNDREMLISQRPLLAQGIVNSILCFLQPD